MSELHDVLPPEAQPEAERESVPASEFKQYRRKQIAELRPFVPGEHMGWALDWPVCVSPEDAKNGSPKLGDMVARNPKNHADQWLVAAQYFADNFEEVANGA